MKLRHFLASKKIITSTIPYTAKSFVYSPPSGNSLVYSPLSNIVPPSYIAPEIGYKKSYCPRGLYTRVYSSRWPHLQPKMHLQFDLQLQPKMGGGLYTRHYSIADMTYILTRGLDIFFQKELKKHVTEIKLQTRMKENYCAMLPHSPK